MHTETCSRCNEGENIFQQILHGQHYPDIQAKTRHKKKERKRHYRAICSSIMNISVKILRNILRNQILQHTYQNSYNQKNQQYRMLEKCGEKWNPHTLLVGKKFGSCLNIAYTTQPSNFTPRYLPKKNKNICQHKDCM